MIAAYEGHPAGETATALRLDRTVFKQRVRRLKELGLTGSLQVGYRLSPRGRAYLDARN